jgi:hypothetical protein
MIADGIVLRFSSESSLVPVRASNKHETYDADLRDSIVSPMCISVYNIQGHEYYNNSFSAPTKSSSLSVVITSYDPPLRTLTVSALRRLLLLLLSLS